MGTNITLDINLLLYSLSPSFISQISVSHIFQIHYDLAKNRALSGSMAKRREGEVWSSPGGDASPESDLSRPRSEAKALPQRFHHICAPGTPEICP